MAYTFGPSHGPFTGNGSFAVAKPTGIRTVLSSIPSWTGHDGAIPRRYFKLGRFTMGNLDGFQYSHGLEYATQLLYPMPPVWELLAYDLRNGVTCVFQELIDVPDLTQKQPWDRTPAPVSQWLLTQVAGGTGATVHWSYTVPVGRRLQVQRIRLYMNRYALSNAAATCYAYINLNGTAIGMITSPANVLNAIVDDNGGIDSWLLPANAVLAGGYVNTEIGGGLWVGTGFQGTLFDA